jgi:Cu2+-exporting ATPase
MRTAFVDRVVRWYVALVLLAAAAGFLAWLSATGDAVRALEVATAVLVVTCPCGFGIATPLAYELAHAGLRRVGLWVRTRDLLDRAVGVRQVVFDKTGTLTDGTLRLADPRALDALAADERALLYDLSIRSTHPKSRAVARALEGQGTFRPEIEVTEVPGRGVEAIIAGRRARLGAPEWAAPGAPGDLAFSIDGTLRAALRTEETLRPDARAEIERLRAAGFEVWILSGDAPERVRELAAVLGVPADHAVGGASPEAKAAWLERHDRGDALVIGDGINDSLAVERAHVSGTPAVDRPFLPSKTDFTFVTPGLWPIGLCLRIARRLGAVVRRNLRWAVAYNVLAVSLSWAGLMVPWLAAVLMPASSILILAATGKSLSTRSPAWKS